MLAASAVTWFEIPSKDLARATRFYEDVLGIQLKPDAMGPKMKFSIFPADKGQPTGCVMQAEGYRPSADSTTPIRIDSRMSLPSTASGGPPRKRLTLSAMRISRTFQV